MIEHPRKEILTTDDLSLRIPRDDAFRWLGIRTRRRPPRPSLLAAYEEEESWARANIRSKALISVGRHGLPGSGFLEPETCFAAAVCTIGPSLGQRVTALSDQGEATRAMILDAIGSAAVEQLANQVNSHICRWAHDAGLVARTRSSPGYGHWTIEEQSLLFAFLQPEAIGVRLTGSMLMIPEKSISFAAPLGTDSGEEDLGRSQTRCTRCGLTDCPYREEHA